MHPFIVFVLTLIGSLAVTAVAGLTLSLFF